ncbi:MAG: urease accessory protein UreD [Burkholderiales bacterium]
MLPVEPPFSKFAANWRAQLALAYERRAVHGSPRTVLATRRHDGPLVVQKALYPEGDAVCHSIIVHPPAGIVGGDSLEMDVRVGTQAHALLTTPGAGKWYRSAGAWAQQRNTFVVGEDACLEWLPQETIVFDGALARLKTEVQLGKGACYIGWEILCLGRAGSGERFQRGQCDARMSVLREGKPLWMERGNIEAGGLLMRSAAGLGSRTVCGTMIAVAENVDTIDMIECRAVAAKSGDTAATRLPGVMVMRYLGDSSEAAKQYFEMIWRHLRPVVAGRAAVAPRIWST